MKVEEEAPKKEEERSKSPGLIARLLAPFKKEKGEKEKKIKAPKSPKAAKKEEVEVCVFYLSLICIH